MRERKTIETCDFFLLFFLLTGESQTQMQEMKLLNPNLTCCYHVWHKMSSMCSSFCCFTLKVMHRVIDSPSCNLSNNVTNMLGQKSKHNQLTQTGPYGWSWHCRGTNIYLFSSKEIQKAAGHSVFLLGKRLILRVL